MCLNGSRFNMEKIKSSNPVDMDFSYATALDSLDIFKEEDTLNIIKDMVPLGMFFI